MPRINIKEYYKKDVKELSSVEFEKCCLMVLRGYAEEMYLDNFVISHNEIVKAHDGDYQVDIYSEFTIFGKSKLDHQRFNQTHDEWYYKMYFDMLKVIFHPTDRFEVYIDIKDSNSYHKAQKLREVCSNSMYDFSQSIIQRLQPIRSEEVQIMQLTDILIGAIAYENRSFPDGFQKSSAKQEIISLIKKRSGYTMKKTTLLREDKLNLFRWDARGTNE